MKSEWVGGHIRDAELNDARGQNVYLLDFLIILSKRRRFILVFTLVVTLLTAIVTLLLPNQYTAETTILPPAQNSSMSSALMGQLGGSSALASVAGASLGIKNPSDMYVSLFQSRTIEDAMVQRFGLMAKYKAKKDSEARAAFERHAKVVLGAKDGIIHVTVKDRDPKQ